MRDAREWIYRLNSPINYVSDFSNHVYRANFQIVDSRHPNNTLDSQKAIGSEEMWKKSLLF